jgi:hypothetical protein
MKHYNPNPAPRNEGTIERICRALEYAGCERELSQWLWPGCWLARCPCDHAQPLFEHSLQLKRGDDGRAELDCMEGCREEAILRALNLCPVFGLAPPFVRADLAA